MKESSSIEYVLDACAVLAFFEEEAGYDTVSSLLAHAAKNEKPVYLSLINWGEIYYLQCRRKGRQGALDAMKDIENLPIEIVGVDQSLVEAAAEIKAAHRMSYADAFAAALAQQKKARLVTSDQEFKSVEKNIKILWL